MISVAIATKDRPDKLARCLRSLRRNTYKDFEIILADQGNSKITRSLIRRFTDLSIRHIYTPRGGKGSALNLAIQKVRGAYIAFTDDDCTVDAHWLERIVSYFQDHPGVHGLFGRTLPYQPKRHKGFICRTVFLKTRPLITNNPYIIYYKDLGIGNNMAFRGSVFERVGGFKEWLGVGSISQAGGIEGEFAYRVLSNKFTLAFEPTIFVYHNKWLTEEEEELLQKGYIIGAVAFYCYYIVQARDLRLLGNLADLRFHIINKLVDVGDHLLRGRLPKKTVRFLLMDLKAFIRGAALGIKQAINDG